MQADRVVVSGMGVVAATGLGVPALWQAAREGRSAVGKFEQPRAEQLRVTIAAQVRGFDASQHIEPKVLPFCDPFAQFALIATDEALSQAGFSRGQPLGERTAVILGTSIGGATTIDETAHTYYESKGRLNPLGIPRTMSNAASSLISARYGCKGPTFSIGSACSSSTQAIGIGAILIRAGIIDRAIVGGCEAALTALSVRAWELMRVLTPDFCRPFSRGRNGMVLGEGAGVFLLEREGEARARGAAPLAEIAGYGTSSDAKDMIRPDVQGAITAMNLAIGDARLAPDEIDYVNAHGTGTAVNDSVESEALRQVFGARLAKLPVSSTKPIHGHALGAAGGLELAIAIMAMRDNVAPPTINWLEHDPSCVPDPVPNRARAIPIAAAMSNSFAFGGINACLVVRRIQ